MNNITETKKHQWELSAGGNGTVGGIFGCTECGLQAYVSKALEQDKPYSLESAFNRMGVSSVCSGTKRIKKV